MSIVYPPRGLSDRAGAAPVEGHGAEFARQRRDLRFPDLVGEMTAGDEDDRIAFAEILVIEADAGGDFGERHWSAPSRSWPDRFHEPRLASYHSASRRRANTSLDKSSNKDYCPIVSSTKGTLREAFARWDEVRHLRASNACSRSGGAGAAQTSLRRLRKRNGYAGDTGSPARSWLTRVSLRSEARRKARHRKSALADLRTIKARSRVNPRSALKRTAGGAPEGGRVAKAARIQGNGPAPSGAPSSPCFAGRAKGERRTRRL